MQQDSSTISDYDYKALLSLDLNRLFEKHLDRSVNASYGDREGRNRFAAKQIIGLGLKNILNIGGGGKRDLIKNINKTFNVFEIDIVGDCDLHLNLDQIDRLPFEDNSFDLCCAFDVLEHLEQFHLINEELYRVSKSSVLIALPNSATEIFYNVVLNHPQKRPDLNRGTFSKFYGLPLLVPEDRHRWWLYFQDIVRFYYFFAQKNKCELTFWTIENGMKRQILSFFLRQHIVNTFFVPHLWIKLDKPKPTQQLL
jgi:hypothetical protein